MHPVSIQVGVGHPFRPPFEFAAVRRYFMDISTPGFIQQCCTSNCRNLLILQLPGITLYIHRTIKSFHPQTVKHGTGIWRINKKIVLVLATQCSKVFLTPVFVS